MKRLKGVVQAAQFALVGSAWLPWQLRSRLLRRLGAKVGNARIDGPCTFTSVSKVAIGERVFINVGCIFDAGAGVTIGDDVAFGPGVRVVSSSHEIGAGQRRVGAGQRRVGAVYGMPVVVEDGAWVGASATLLPGVKVARGCVIAAGAVVTRSTEPDGVYAGVPARRVRDLD